MNLKVPQFYIAWFSRGLNNHRIPPDIVFVVLRQYYHLVTLTINLATCLRAVLINQSDYYYGQAIGKFEIAFSLVSASTISK